MPAEDTMSANTDTPIDVDLYSDTVTKPTTAMRRFMCEAPVGDEQKSEDPTVNQLQEMVAELLGKEAAVFLPSGTMCNEIAMRVHGRPRRRQRAPPRRRARAIRCRGGRGGGAARQPIRAAQPLALGRADEQPGR